MADINGAEGKELFESLFAGTGSRETISIKDWISGWPAIVGGINGIPTSRQFNTLQHVTDIKCLLLYRDILMLRDEIAELREMIETGGGGAVPGKGGFVYVGSINKEINAGDILFVITEDIDGGRVAAGGLVHVGNAGDGISEGDVLFILEHERVTLGTEGGMVYAGAVGTGIRPRGVLFITGGDAVPVFLQARVTDMAVGRTAPDAPNWGFVEGRLTVAEEPLRDTVFYGKIGGEGLDGQ